MVMKQGYAMQSLCIEALPFDGRVELWDTSSEGEWERLVPKSSGGELVSVIEYVKTKGDEKGTSQFAELVLLAFKQVGEPVSSNDG